MNVKDPLLPIEDHNASREEQPDRRGKLQLYSVLLSRRFSFLTLFDLSARKKNNKVYGFRFIVAYGWRWRWCGSMNSDRGKEGRVLLSPEVISPNTRPLQTLYTAIQVYLSASASRRPPDEQQVVAVSFRFFRPGKVRPAEKIVPTEITPRE